MFIGWQHRSLFFGEVLHEANLHEAHNTQPSERKNQHAVRKPHPSPRLRMSRGKKACEESQGHEERIRELIGQVESPQQVKRQKWARDHIVRVGVHDDREIGLGVPRNMRAHFCPICHRGEEVDIERDHPPLIVAKVVQDGTAGLGGIRGLEHEKLVCKHHCGGGQGDQSDPVCRLHKGRSEIGVSHVSWVHHGIRVGVESSHLLSKLPHEVRF
mmetsp:Transcript_14712/g.21419  ORF Transcript_14712/g.21419 Transcript_14712/m.21419 type:complete len:214 (+) Transcript_14712:852-1493(+)